MATKGPGRSLCFPDASSENIYPLYEAVPRRPRLDKPGNGKGVRRYMKKETLVEWWDGRIRDLHRRGRGVLIAPLGKAVASSESPRTSWGGGEGEGTRVGPSRQGVQVAISVMPVGSARWAGRGALGICSGAGEVPGEKRGGVAAAAYEL